MIQSLKDVLVVSDMDGTLLTRNQELLPCNLETIRLFTALGGRFTVATGRMFESVSKYAQLLEFMQPAITCGGCVIYDFMRRRVLKSERLPRVIAHRVMKDMAIAYPRISILVAGDDARFYQIAPSVQAQQLLDEENVSFFVRAADDLPPKWNKMLFAGPADMMPEVLAFLQEKTYAGVNFVATSKKYVEMMPEGIGKGSALLELCKILDVPPQNTIAIGDYFNDMDVMRVAGKSVAMSNAPKEVKMIAQHVTGGCNDGGVGQYLYRLIQQYG